MKIYIACGLTHVPREDFAAYVLLIDRLAQSLTVSTGAEVKYALKDSDPQLAEKPFADRARLCYVWDKEMVEWADVVIAEASYASTGLGIELQIACARETPIVMMFNSSEKNKAPPVEYTTPDQEIHMLQLGEGYISLMALGIPSVFKIFSYLDSDEACEKIVEIIKTLRKPN